jgi:hypothetical protein
MADPFDGLRRRTSAARSSPSHAALPAPAGKKLAAEDCRGSKGAPYSFAEESYLTADLGAPNPLHLHVAERRVFAPALSPAARPATRPAAALHLITRSICRDRRRPAT